MTKKAKAAEQTARRIGEGEVALTDRAGLTLPAFWVAESAPSGPVPGQRDTVIRLRWAGGEAEGRATDAFAALKRVREQLEACGLILVCYGASRRAILTGMARDAGGRKVYHARLGRPLHRDQLVYLMDAGADVEPTTVAEQEEFRRQFWASVRAGQLE